MPLHFVRNDITKMDTDAIVLPANPALEPGDGSHFFSDIEEFIDDDYVDREEVRSNRRERFRGEGLQGRFDKPDWYDQEAAFQKKQNAPADTPPIEEVLGRRRETFRDLLLRMIDEKGMTHSAVYNAANVSKQVFNSIKHKEDYIPWFTSATSTVNRALSKEILVRKGFYDLADAYQQMHVNY